MKRKITVPLSGITCLALLSLVGCFDDAQEDREGSRAGVKPRGGEPTVAEKARRAATRMPVDPDHKSLGSANLDVDSKFPLVNVGGVDVYKTAPFHAVIYHGGMMIDADGAPHAYHPRPDSSKGLDHLADAGSPGNWWGIATDNGESSGTPIIQDASNPAPGFYIATTALDNPKYHRTDPRRFVNASKIPFIVLPVGHNNFGGRIGDIAAVVNFANGKVAYAIAADEGPENKLGEGSIALAKALGVNPSARTGGTGHGIGYCFFPGSGTHRPQPIENINQTGSELFSDFGGVEVLKQMLSL